MLHSMRLSSTRALVSKLWPVSEEGTRSLEWGYNLRSGSESEDIRTLEEPVDWKRFPVGGGRVKEHHRTLVEGVVCDTSQEDGRLLYTSQNSKCGSEDQTRLWLDLVAVGRRVWMQKRRLPGMLDGIQSWRQIHSEHEEGAVAKEQTQRRNRRGLEIQPCGDCWIEQAMRWMYIEA